MGTVTIIGGDMENTLSVRHIIADGTSTVVKHDTTPGPRFSREAIATMQRYVHPIERCMGFMMSRPSIEADPIRVDVASAVWRGTWESSLIGSQSDFENFQYGKLFPHTLIR